MRSILEKAFDALLNEQQDKAEELFHKFIVERSRQILESNRMGQDFELEENWADEVQTESYFTEEDLDALNGDDEGDAAGEFGDAGEPEDDAGAFGDDMGDEPADDDLAGEPADDVDGLGDVDGAEEGGSVEDQLEDIKDSIEQIAADFAAAMEALAGGEDAAADDIEGDLGVDGDEPADFGGEAGEDDGAEDFGGDVGGDEFGAADAPEDDMEDDQPMESADDEFDNMMESIIDELEKVSVTLDDGKEIGTGSSFTQVKTATIPQKNKDARQGGEPIKQKRDDHKGFERETAPPVTDMKKRRNTKTKGTDGQSSVSKEGDKSAEINKLGSEENTKSVL